jgi:hypothetical protein
MGKERVWESVKELIGQTQSQRYAASSSLKQTNRNKQAGLA